MIKLNKIFQQLDEEANQQFLNLMNNDEVPLCPFDIITCNFIDKDKIVFEELIPEIKKLINDDSFQSRIVQLEKDKAKNELQSIKAKLKITNYTDEEKKRALCFYKPTIKRNLNISKKLDFDIFVLNCNDTFNGMVHIKDIEDDFDFYRNNYKYVCIANILFEDFKKSKSAEDRFNVPQNNALEKLYTDNSINLKNTDRQYDKYQLLTIDQNFEISISNIPKVKDTRINSYLFINEISPDFLQILKNLREKGYISSLALRPEYINVIQELEDLSIGLEEKEFGNIFAFEDLEVPSITKLYSSTNYENKLWIIINNKNITFEETLDDFERYDSFIVTQVIHLEYEEINGQYYIKHLDHEYIFYSENEYKERLNNPMQKGEARKRFKTFKIDDSKIPFILNEELENNSFFLYIVLNIYFENKELLKEYFENVLKN